MKNTGFDFIKKPKRDSNDSKKILSIYLMIIIISSSFIIIRIPVAKTDGSGNYPAPVNGDWVITENTYATNETITLNGNLIIENNGSLTLRNVTLIINCTSDWQYYIDVKTGGKFYVTDLDNDKETVEDVSIITSGNINFEYRFNIRTGATFDMRNSELSECGYDNDHRGLIVESSDVKILNNTISNCYDGIASFRCNPIIENNTIYKCVFGIFNFNENTYPTIKNNTLHNNSYSIYIHYNSRSIIPKMDNNTANGIDLKTIYHVNENGTIVENIVRDSGHSNGYSGAINYEGLITFYDCTNFTVRNCTLSNNLAGVYSYNSEGKIKENEISGCSYGTYSINGMGVIKENKFYGNTYSIYTYRLPPIIENNEIVNDWRGIYTYQSNPVIRNNTMSVTNIGILTYYKTVGDLKSPIIENTTINSNWGGIYSLQNAPTVFNSTINANTYDFYQRNLCYPTVFNTTFDKNKIYFHDKNSILSINWFLNVKVVNETGSSVENVKVTVKDKSKELIYENTTNKNGTIPYVICKEFEQDQKSRTYFTPHIVRVKKDLGNETFVNVNETKNITLVLGNLPELFISNISFSNENPNQGDLININATIENIGEVNVTNITVSFFDGRYFITKDDISVVTNNSTITSIEWIARGGKHAIKVIVDHEDDICEYNETNNSLKRIIFGNDWVVTTSEYYEDEIIYMYGNLTIENSGNLTLKNVTLLFNCREDGNYHIEVKDGGEFNILGKMEKFLENEDYNNLSGKRDLDYWIEEYTEGVSATVWVNVPFLLSGNKTIYMYYNNSSTDSTTDFDNTFTKDFYEIGLQGLWHMDESSGTKIFDSSKNNNTGELLEKDAPSWVGNDGGFWNSRDDISFSNGDSLNFDGFDDYVEVPASSDFNIGTNLTIEAWVNPDTLRNYAGVVSKNIAGLGEEYTYLAVVHGNGAIGIYSPSSNWVFSSAGLICAGTWTHVTWVWDESTVKFYINGVFDSSQPMIILDNYQTHTVKFGRWHTGTTTYVFDGLIDEVAINNRALTPEEIKAHFERRKYAFLEPSIYIENEEKLNKGTEWNIRKAITINNPGYILSDYQVKINIDYESSMKTDFSDLRFVEFLDGGVGGKGDYDLIIGEKDGNFIYYKNNGTIKKPKWELKGALKDKYGSEIDAGWWVNPTFVDLDNDGDFDIIRGWGNPDLKYYENTGTKEIAEWTEDDTKFSGVDTSHQSKPSFADLDNDNDLDLIVGDVHGTIKFFENTGTVEESIWTENSSVVSGINVDAGIAPALVDLNDDKDFDLAIGDSDGNLHYYENTGTINIPTWTANTSMFSGINVRAYATPAFADLDGDSDFDLTIGEYDGNLSYFKNTGTKKKPLWTEDTQMFLGIDIGERSTPAFADLDNDGSYFIKGSKIISNNTKSYLFWVNKGAKLIIQNTEINNCGYDSTFKNKGLYIEAENSTILNATFINNYNALILVSKNNTLTNSTISQNNGGIILGNSSNNEICENIIESNLQHGINIYSKSSNNLLKNNTFSNNEKGINISDSRENTFVGNQIINNYYGIFITLSNNIDLVNCTSISNIEDLNIHNSIVTSINSSFNQDEVVIRNGGELNVKWYLQVNVVSKNSKDATILINDLNHNEIFHSTTISNHWKKGIICREYIEYEGGRIYYTPYEIEISKKGIYLNESKINMNSNKKVSINWPDYAVYLECLESEKNVLPDETINYNINIENWGEKEDNIYLSLKSIYGWITYLDKTNFLLGNDSTGYANLTVIAQNSLFESVGIDIKATSASNFSRTHNITVLNLLNKFTKINPLRNIIQKSSNPGEEVEYIFEIENDGNHEFKIFLEVNESLSDNFTNWSISNLSQLDPLNLEIGEIGTIPISVTPPLNGISDENRKIVFDIKLLESNAKLGEITTNTKINQIHEIELIINTNKQEVYPGEIIEFEINITNKGNGIDTIKLDYFGKNKHWAFDEWTSNHLTLEINETKTVIVYVKPPIDSTVEEFARIVFNPTYSEIEFLTMVKQFHSAIIDIEKDFYIANPDELITLEFNIINNGNGWDELSLSFNESASNINTGWEYGNPRYKEMLIPNGGSFSENFNIQTSKYAAGDETSIFVFDVLSQNTNNVLITKTVIIPIRQIYDLIFDSEILEKTIFAGKSYVYNISVTNLGNGNDTIKMDYVGENRNWCQLSNSILNIERNGTMNIFLIVDIPESAEKGEKAEISVISFSENQNISNILTFTTIVNKTKNISPTSIIKIKHNDKLVTKIMVGQEITFDGGYSFDVDGEITEYKWNLGNGVVLYGKTINYTFPKETKPEDYIINLTLTDNNGTMSDSKKYLTVLGEEEKINYESYIVLISLLVVGTVVIVMLARVIKEMKVLSKK